MRQNDLKTRGSYRYLSLVQNQWNLVLLDGWMPAADIYFKDPDGNLIEYLTMLDDNLRRPETGIISWSECIARNR